MELSIIAIAFYLDWKLGLACVGFSILTRVANYQIDKKIEQAVEQDIKEVREQMLEQLEKLKK